jgi:hypothetical protein
MIAQKIVSLSVGTVCPHCTEFFIQSTQSQQTWVYILVTCTSSYIQNNCVTRGISYGVNNTSHTHSEQDDVFIEL